VAVSGTGRLVRALGVAFMATSVEVASRCLVPVPFALHAEGVAVAFGLYALLASPAVLLDRPGARLRPVGRVFFGLPIAMIVPNVGYAMGAKEPLLLLVLFGAGLVLVTMAGGLLNGRAMAVVAVAAVAVTGAARMRVGRAGEPGMAPSVLMVVLDTTAAGHLSTYGYERPTAPNLDAFAARSLLYTRAVSAAPWTIPSHAAIFSGHYPSELGFAGFDFAAGTAAGSIAADLAATGRVTAAISANPFVPQNPTLRTGFAESWDVLQLTQPLLLKIADHLRGHWGYRGPGFRVTELALDWLDRIAPHGQPWFLFVNYMDPHAPYTPPARERREFAPEVPRGAVADDPRYYNTGTTPLTPQAIAAMRALYDGEVHAMDRALGRLLDELAARGFDASNLLIVILADHGETLGEHGMAGHLLGMWETLLHVPLLIEGLGVEPGRVEVPVQPVQLRATIRVLLGLPPLPSIAGPLPPWGAAPDLLVSQRHEMAWYFDELREVRDDFDAGPWRGDWVAVERDGRKVIFDEVDKRGAAYDLRADPEEAHPQLLPPGDPLLAAYREWLVARAPIRSGEPVAGTRERLHALGYIR
jgi:arylsulfatase A-like enzyme